MSNFEIKTHKPGTTYQAPHFFILNKGNNSGKPLKNPCPNCFVITTETEELQERLFYMCLSLKTARYFKFYLKGSVIPFITINDAKKVILEALAQKSAQQWEQIRIKLKHIEAYENNLREQLKKISEYKLALLRF